jgi:putative Mg2+ transporter-C (MgtC) family protein
MESLRDAIFVDLGDPEHFLRVLARLAVAALCGSILGWQRQEEGKAAGLRTHLLVALGAAGFVIASLEAGAKVRDLQRVVQGLTMAIGFVGGGTILKLPRQERIRGLTTAASLWVAAAAGTALGLGQLWPAVTLVSFGWLALEVLGRLEHREGQQRNRSTKERP